MFSALLANRPAGGLEIPGFLDSVWVNASCIVAVPQYLQPPAPEFWSFVSNAGVTAGGDPHWIGGFATGNIANTSGVGVFRGIGSERQRLIGTGDQVVGLQGVIAAVNGIKPADRSLSGSLGVAIVRLAGSGSASIEAIVGWQPNVSPWLVASNSDIGSGTWRRFDQIAAFDRDGCDSLPGLLIAGQVRTRTGFAHVLVRGGAEIHREGDIVQGLELQGGPIGLDSNSAGDYAVVWLAKAPGQVARPALIVNGSVVETWVLPPLVAIAEPDSVAGTVDVYFVKRAPSATSLYRSSIARPALPCEQCTTCVGDFDRSGGVDGDDIAAFFTAWQAGDPCADVDASGGVDGDDIPYFFDHWQAGAC